jgi:hypothetical protein
LKTLSINGQDTSENETKEVFVIVAANLEYNDETYDQWGELLLKKNYYFSFVFYYLLVFYLFCFFIINDTKFLLIFFMFLTIIYF